MKHGSITWANRFGEAFGFAYMQDRVEAETHLDDSWPNTQDFLLGP